MKFSIVSINDERKDHKNAIRDILPYEEVEIESYDGRNVDHHAEMYIRGLNDYGTLTPAEAGIWYSHWDRWQWSFYNTEELIVFEDDAILDKNFPARLGELMKELPKDWDYLSLWVPPDQTRDYLYDVEYTEDGQMVHLGPDRNMVTSKYNYGGIRTCRVYQGYGLVATLYSPRAGKKLIELSLDYRGMPVDCAIHAWSHQGKLEGFAPKPHHAKLVKHDYTVLSIRGQNAV